MAFWSRLRQSKIKLNLFRSVDKRFYTVNGSTILSNEHIRPHTVNRISDRPYFVVQGGILNTQNVRFYAKPAQSFQKKEDADPSGPRLNEQITAPVVRLVSDEGHSVISRYEAMTRARNLKMDLVEVDRHAQPPVCKIFDFHKEKYVQKTKEKERSKMKDTLKKGPCKEIRFAAKIKQNDLQMKADAVKRLMESGYRVKCTAIDPIDGCDLSTLLSRFSALIKDVAVLEGDPKVEKKQAFVVVRHIKFGPPKKGSGKNKSSSEVSVSSQSEDPQPEENGSKTGPGGPDDMPDQDAGSKKTAWAVFDEDDDINKIFDINEQNGHQGKSSLLEQPPGLNRPSSSYPTDINHTVNRYARDPMAEKPARINSRPQMRQYPPHEPFKQNSSGPHTPNSLNKSYGIFSAPKLDTTPNEQNVPAENNRYKKSVPSGSGRNPTADNSRMNKRPGANNNPRGGQW